MPDVTRLSGASDDDLTRPAPASEAATVLSDPSRAGLRPAAPPTLGPGTIFGPYRIERLLGRGGMGEVYEAEHLEHGRRVALKVLAARLTGPDDQARFLREGEVAASINHPNTVYVYGSEEIDGAPVIAMELVSGGTLRDRVHETGALTPKDAVDLILHVVAGLEAAQAAGILHRDIKPANCFIDRDGVVKVGDFGLSIAAGGSEAQATGLGFFQGTPQFAPPEQIRGEALDVTADIYSVGATLFYLLTGQPPFDDQDLTTLITRVKTEVPRSPRAMQAGVPAGLAEVVARCLAKDRAGRPASYAVLEDALRPFSSTAPVPAPLGRRLAAGLLDQALYMIAASPMIYTQTQAVLEGRLNFNASVVGLVAFFTYFAALEGRWGASLGKRMLGLHVTTSDGHRAGFGRAAVRSVVYQLPSVVTILLGVFAGPNAFSRESAVEHPILGAMVGLSFYAILAVLFSTARRRNGFAAIQDLASGTRVVRRLARAGADAPALPAPLAIARGAAADGRERVGPFEIVGPIGQTTRGQLLQARDERLGRDVWIHRLAPGAPSVPMVLRDLGRPGRLRWLTGRRTATEAWDAYEAFEGVPLARLDSVQAWRHVRRWLHDLTRELDAARRDGSLDAVSIDQVWLTRDGGAKLLDFGIDSGREPGPAVDPRTPQGAAAVLSAVAARTLAGASVNAGGHPLLPATLPLSARTLLDRLGRPSDQSLADVQATLVGMGREPDRVSRLRRAGALALCTACPLFSLFGLAMTSAMARTMPVSPEAEHLGVAMARLQVLGDSPDESRRASAPALEVYIAGRFAATIAAEDTWTNPLTAVRLRPHRDRARAVLARHPRVTPEEMAAVSTSLGSVLTSLEKQMRDRETSMREVMRALPLFGLAMGFVLAAGFGVVLAFALRGGLSLRAFGLAVVNGRGERSSRLRALVRAVIAWAPAPIMTIAAFVAVILMNSPRASASSVTIAVAAAVVATLAFVAGVAIAVIRPARGIQDAIARTYLVPR